MKTVITQSGGLFIYKPLFLLLCLFVLLAPRLNAQNVGIGTTTPAGKVHIKGSADTTQLMIDANSTQSNSNPLIKLRNSSGTSLLWIHSDNPNNTFIGLNAGRVNNAGGGGVYNTFIGSQAGYSNSTGSSNTANGMGALYATTTGGANTANGINALYNNVAGYNAVAIGYYSQYNANNTATTWDNTNTSIGYQSLMGSPTPANNTGISNVAIGRDALYSNSSGSGNIANGQGALFSNTTASRNTAIGYSALANQSYNPGFAWNSDNVAVGYEALLSNQPVGPSAGINNTAVGNYALHANTQGDENTANGERALYSNTTGWGNTALGRGADVSGGDLTNATVIGYSAIVTGSNRMMFGNIAVTGLYSMGAGLFAASDARFKNNVEETVPGLSFITKLRPVTYHYDLDKMAKYLNTPDDLRLKEAEALKSKILYSGFIAQEVEKAASDIGYDFSGLSKPKNEKDYYAIDYAELTVPLVKAVQEQQQMLKEQKDEIELLKAENDSMKSDLEKIKAQLGILPTVRVIKN